MTERRKVLVIEDDKTVQLILKQVVEKAGFQAVPALDAMQGVMMARQVKPALIVLDLNMPAGGGGSVYERIGQMNGTFDIPILVYSAMTREQAERKVPPGPYVRFLAKPATPEQLTAAIRELLP